MCHRKTFDLTFESWKLDLCGILLNTETLIEPNKYEYDFVMIPHNYTEVGEIHRSVTSFTNLLHSEE